MAGKCNLLGISFLLCERANLMMNIDDVCSRAMYQPNIYVPALKDELVRLREQEKEAERLRRVIRMALDSFEEKCPLIAEQTLRLSLEK
jgi:hypothetical protein